MDTIETKKTKFDYSNESFGLSTVVITIGLIIAILGTIAGSLLIVYYGYSKATPYGDSIAIPDMIVSGITVIVTSLCLGLMLACIGEILTEVIKIRSNSEK